MRFYNMKQLGFLIFLILLMAFPLQPARGQTPTPASGPVYVVQEGDTLWEIANRFGVSVEEIQSVNNLSTTDIFTGDKLIIPGLEGLSGTLMMVEVHYGETMESLSQQYDINEPILSKLNHIVSPAQLYAGYELIVIEQDTPAAPTLQKSLTAGESLLELAILNQSDPWTLALSNRLSGPSAGLPGQILYLPTNDPNSATTGLPPEIKSVEIDPVPLVQGTTVQIKAVPGPQISLGGELVDHALHFYPLEHDTQIALGGVHAMLDPGLYPLRLDATLEDGTTQSYVQLVLVKSGDFLNDPALEVEPSTIDPAVTGPEDEWLRSITSQSTPTKYWNGKFQMPVASPACTRSGFGNRRSYNGGELLSFHTGLDFGICSEEHPFDIYAAADGVIVFTGLKTVRGNATIIDHGWGVFSAYYHQEEIYVSSGETVKAGQLIGKIGTTGRVTGPHLHFEVWVNGIQVNPQQWLQNDIPG
jgi:murein DD-endopeptidase MepM/ murein hydrolase activator NlpD